MTAGGPLRGEGLALSICPSGREKAEGSHGCLTFDPAKLDLEGVPSFKEAPHIRGTSFKYSLNKTLP